MSQRDLQALPKAHLHLHLDGALRPKTLLDGCASKGLRVPAIPDSDVTYTGFAQFLDVIEMVQPLLSDAAFLVRVVRELVEDAVADGAVWIEPSVYPGFFGPMDAPRTRDVIALISETGSEAAARHGAGFGLMLSANRRRGASDAIEVARLAAACIDLGVVSFGLDGDEVASPPGAFVRSFEVAREAGLLATPHAGEFLGPAAVADAVELLGADRIAHGITAVERREVIQMLVERDVCLDVCPTSNVRLGRVPSMSLHPLGRLLDMGVRCSLNADDPLLFGSSLLGEYRTCREVLKLDDTALAHIAATSILSSGAPSSDASEWLGSVASWLGAGHGLVELGGPGDSESVRRVGSAE